MALLKGGANYFTLEGVKSIAEKGEQELHNLMGATSEADYYEKLIQEVLNKLDHLIGILKKGEREVLDALGAKDLSDLEKRFQDFYINSGYSQFVNINLSKIVKTKYEEATNAQKAKLYETYRNILYNLLDEACKSIGEDISSSKQFTDETRKAALTKMAELLRKYGFDGSSGTGKGGLTYTSKIVQWDSKDGDLSFFPELASSITIRRLEVLRRQAAELALKENHMYSNEEKEQLIHIAETKVFKSSASDTQASVNIGFIIGNITEGKTPTEAKALSGPILKQKNEEIRDAIVHEINPQYQKTAKKIIDKMLNTGGDSIDTSTMFFSGASAEQLKGTLGEIGAMHAITNLLGYKEPTDEIIQWVATNKTQGKQLSIDIILKNFKNIKCVDRGEVPDFGVQIKDVENNRVDFVDASFDYIMEKLKINTTYIENTFFSDDFNIPYEYNLETQRYVPMFEWKNRLANAEDFLAMEAQIDTTVQEFKSYLMLHAADFLYMGLGDEFVSSLATLNSELNTLSGNILYIVRDTPFFASEMLIKIRASIQKSITNVKNPFKIESYIGDLDSEAGSLNIISYLNAQNTGKKVKEIHEYKVKLTSSYLFSK